MTVGELISKLADLNPDTPVVVPDARPDAEGVNDGRVHGVEVAEVSVEYLAPGGHDHNDVREWLHLDGALNREVAWLTYVVDRG